MPSTEFLLYLVIVIFAVFLIMNYYKGWSNDPSVRHKDAANNRISEEYIPIYKTFDDDNRSGVSRRSYGSHNPHTKYHGNEYMTDVQTNDTCNNPQCIQYGQCRCEKNINIDIQNRQEYRQYPNMRPFPNIPSVPSGPPVPPIDPLRKFDYDSVNDEFTPPFRRSYYDENNYRLAPGLYPTYTRGPPGRFRKIGTLVAEGVAANDKYKFLLLMGRQRYPNGNDYEYYATSADADQRLKFYIETKGKEICDGDNIKLPELEGYLYLFREDQDLSPKYDPYMI
jgi:hypothetical protein